MTTLTGMRVDALEHWGPADGARDRRVRLATRGREDPQTDRGRPPPAVGQLFLSRLLLCLIVAVVVRVAIGDSPVTRIWTVLTS